MAADFDAGSIEGTLDIDTKPFYAGIRKARAEAAAFERKRVEADAGLDTTEFTAEKAKVEAQLVDLGMEKAEPEVELEGVPETLLGIGLIRRAFVRLRRAALMTGVTMALTSAMVAAVSLTTSLIAMVGQLVAANIGILVLIAAVVALGVALTPVIAALGLFATALAVAFLGILPPLILAGVVIAKFVKVLVEANKAGDKLKGWAGAAQEAFGRLSDAWTKLTEKLRPAVFRTLNTVFRGLTQLLPKLYPLLRTVLLGINGIAKAINRVTRSDKFTRFLSDLNEVMSDFMPGLARVIEDIAITFMNTFHRLHASGVLADLGNWILSIVDGLRRWSTEGGGLQKWIDYIQKNAPQIKRFLVEMGKALGAFFDFAVKHGPGMLDFFSDVIKWTGKIIGAITAVNARIDSATSRWGARIDGFVGKVKGAWNSITGFTSRTWKVITSAVSGAWNTITSAARRGWNLVRAGVNGAWSAIRRINSATWGAIRGAISAAWNFITSRVTGAANAVRSRVSSTWNSVRSATSNAWDSIKSTVSNAWDNIKQAVSRGADAIMGVIRSLPGRISAIASGMWNSLRAGLDSVIAGIKSTINSMISGANKIPGVSIPHLAKGARNFPGGLALVGELGPELVTLPRGSNVHTAAETERIRRRNDLSDATIPKRDEGADVMRRLAARLAANENRMLQLLAALTVAASKGDNDELAEKLGAALSKHSEATMRKVVQIARSA